MIFSQIKESATQALAPKEQQIIKGGQGNVVIIDTGAL